MVSSGFRKLSSNTNATHWRFQLWRCCKQCGQVKFMGTMTKWPVKNTQNITKHGVYKDSTDIKNNYFLCFSDFSGGGGIFNFHLLNGLLQKMLNYRLGTVNEKHWGFKPVFRCSKPHTFSTFSGEDKEKMSIHSF